MLFSNGSDGSLIHATAALKTRKPGGNIRSESPRDVCTSEVTAQDAAVAPKPFFVMDWLEQLRPTDLALARQVLQAPPPPEATTETVANDSHKSLEENSDRELYPSPVITILPKKPDSPFLRRSVSMGNGWNAKGLRKAKMNKWKEALVCWENALEIRSQVLGEHHLDVANTCNNIGIAHGKLDHINEAMSFLHRALDIRIAHYGQDHQEVAATLHNIGNVHQQAGDLEGAIQCFCQSKNIQASLLGSEHPQIARACISMGHVYYQACEYEDARLAYFDALSIFEKAGLRSDNLEVKSLVKDITDLERLIMGL
jgi:tetratricopeptide (TPR) repeat protein